MFPCRAMCFSVPVGKRLLLTRESTEVFHHFCMLLHLNTRVGTLIVATIYLQLIQNRYMFRSFTVLQCSHQHCVQPVASDVGLSPCDFHLIPKMKEPLRGIRFRTVPEILQAVDRSIRLSTQQALLKVSYDFHIAGNGLYTMLVTTMKDTKTSKHVSILYQL